MKKTKEPITLTRLRNLLRVMEIVAKKPRGAYDIAIVLEEFATARAFAEARDLPERAYPRCGTVACTAGWAGLDPWFRRRGIVTNRKTENVRINGESPWAGGAFWAKFGPYFGLDDDEARTLFYSGPAGEDSSAHDIVKCLRPLVRKCEKAAKASS